MPYNDGNNINQKKPLSEQAREDKSLSRTIYGSGLGNDEVTRNALNGKGRQGSKKERKREREREKETEIVSNE